MDEPLGQKRIDSEIENTPKPPESFSCSFGKIQSIFVITALYFTPNLVQTKISLISY